MCPAFPNIFLEALIENAFMFTFSASNTQYKSMGTQKPESLV